MPKYIVSYKVKVFSPTEKKSVAYVCGLIKEWRQIISLRARKKNKSPTHEYECQSCLYTGFKRVTNYVSKCKACHAFVHARKLTGRSNNSQTPPDPEFSYPELRLIASPTKRKKVFPKCVVIDTWPVEFCDNHLRRCVRDHNESCGRASQIDYTTLCVPHPIYWQSHALVCLMKLLELVTVVKNCVVNPASQTNSPQQSVLDTYKLQFLKHQQSPGKALGKTEPGVVLVAKQRKLLDPQLNAFIRFLLGLIAKQYKAFQDENLNYGSLNKRKQGKFSNERKLIVAKRCFLTARAMILPEPTLKPNEIALPFKMWRRLFDKSASEYCVINRMPSLFPENFSAHRIAVVWDKNCIGLPNEVLNGHHADFDGDEMNVYAASNKASQLEIFKLLNPEANMHSITMPNHMKLSPSKDALQAWHIKGNKGSLGQHLSTVYNTGGSKACFDAFVSLNQQTADFTTKFCLSINLNEMANIAESMKQRNMSLEEFAEFFEQQSFSLKYLLNDSVTIAHLYQSLVRLGYQFYPPFMNPREIVSNAEIRGNLFHGLNAFEQLAHSQSGYSSMVSSINDVSAAGYEQHKLCFNVMDVLVDKQHRLVENGRVICSDPLRYHCIDALMPNYAVESIIEKMKLV